jgi:hypothetical protein
MDPDKPSLLKRVLAILVLVLVAALAIRLVIGFVAGIVTAVLWIFVLAVLVGAVLWARSTLKSGKRRRAVKKPASPAADLAAAPREDLVAAEMRRISEQLREQRRR